MELIKAIEERRSIRNFKKDDISKEKVLDILNSGRLAPSAKNRQPWNFAILQKEMKDKVADLMIEFEDNNKDTENKIYGVKSSVKESAEIIKQAPILILVFRPKDDNWIIGDNLSIGACVQNMCLRATDLGLGSLWIRDIVYISRQVEDMIGYKDLELNCAVILGIPNENPKKRPRKKLNDIVEWFE